MSHSTRLIINIMTLYTLGDLQGEERLVQLSPAQNDQRYSLEFHREKQLAETFAFLAAKTDNMHKVVAVTVEERAHEQGLLVEWTRARLQ